MKMAILALLLSLPIGAEASPYVSGGHEYTLVCNSNGYVLISVNNVVRGVGTGADTRSVKGREKIFLGKSCDAYHKTYGVGKWCWANGGFRADFPEMSFPFGRQELYCPTNNETEVELSCRC
jgi:hypothetical protein